MKLRQAKKILANIEQAHILNTRDDARYPIKFIRHRYPSGRKIPIEKINVAERRINKQNRRKVFWRNFRKCRASIVMSKDIVMYMPVTATLSKMFY